MQLFLHDAGHLVEIAHNGVEAFVIARNLRPDVALCDMRYPGWMVTRLRGRSGKTPSSKMFT